MKRCSPFIRFLPLTALLPVVAALCIHCNYRDTLVDPDDAVEPLFTVRGSISQDISDEYFTGSTSAKIGLIPVVDGFSLLHKVFIPCKPEYHRYTPFDISSDFGTVSMKGDQFLGKYPSVSFYGEFPRNFTSRFESLPVENMTSVFTAPSGKEYRLGIYAIALFDDVDKDGMVHFNAELVDTPQSGICNATSMLRHALDSDQWIGICPDYFIVYIEDAAFLDEMNTHIAGHFGADAQWEGLTAGYNLVTFTSPVTFDNVDFTGVRACPDSTGVNIISFDLDDFFDPETYIPVTLAANYWLFYFQRFYTDYDYSSIGVKGLSGNTTLYVKVAGNLHNGFISIIDDSTGTWDDDPMIKVNLKATGVFDQGYFTCFNPLKGYSHTIPSPHGRSLIVNGKSCADFSPLYQLRDTISLVDGDTLSIDFAKQGSTDCGSPNAPVAVDAVNIIIELPLGAPKINAVSVE